MIHKNENEEKYEKVFQLVARGLQKYGTEFSQLENNCIYVKLSGEFHAQLGEAKPNAFKVNGATLLLLEKGEANIELNAETYHLSAPAIMSLNHGEHVLVHAEEASFAEAYVLIYSPTFLHDVNITFSAIASEVLSAKKNPVFELRPREVPLLLRYFGLFHAVMDGNQDTQTTRHIVSSLTSAFFYQMLSLVYSRIEMSHDESSAVHRNNYVQDFMKLLHGHFNRERSVNFYASKLFISPKYLSLLVKEATGRSAAKWIDYFVIMEAKNLLRYSGKNVQQVAYALNFSNQSSFGKYFKHLTGLSPTEYQKQS